MIQRSRSDLNPSSVNDTRTGPQNTQRPQHDQDHQQADYANEQPERLVSHLSRLDRRLTSEMGPDYDPLFLA